MTPEQFCYWLQGFMELSDDKELDACKTQAIRDHLKLVLKKETPERRPYSNIAPGKIC